MIRCYALVLAGQVFCAAAVSSAGPTPVINSDFRTDKNRDGQPDGWRAIGKDVRFLAADQGGPAFRFGSPDYWGQRKNPTGVLAGDRVAVTPGARYRVRVHVSGHGHVHASAVAVCYGTDRRRPIKSVAVRTAGRFPKRTVLAADVTIPAGAQTVSFQFDARCSTHPTREYEYIHPQRDPHWVLHRVEVEAIDRPEPTVEQVGPGLVKDTGKPGAPWRPIRVARWDRVLNLSPATEFRGMYYQQPYPPARVRCTLRIDGARTVRVPFDLSTRDLLIVSTRAAQDVPVNNLAANELYILWSAALLKHNIPGGRLNGFVDPAVAHLELVGLDDKAVRVPLRWHQDLCDRRDLDWPLATSARVWTDKRTDPKTKKTAETQGLWVYRWVNPNPTAEFKAIRFRTGHAHVRLYVHAVTARSSDAQFVVDLLPPVGRPKPVDTYRFPKGPPKANPPLTRLQKWLVDASYKLDDVTMWHSIVTFLSGDLDRIRKTSTFIARRPYVESGDYGWILFPAYYVYKCFPEHLTPQARHRIEQAMWDTARNAWARRATYSAVKTNINHSLYGAMLRAVAGEVFKNPRWTRDAEYAYDCLFKYLEQTGTVAEYNSPVYLEIDFSSMGLTELYTTDRRVRLKNRLMQEILFWDIVARYHRPTTACAGPHSRAYPLNTHDIYSVPRFLLARQLDEIPFRDWTRWAAPAKAWSAYQLLAEVRFPQFFPAYLRPFITKRPYPYLARAYSRCMDWSIRYKPKYMKAPDEINLLTTYQTPRYAIGSSSRSHWGGGQNDLAMVHYVRRTPPRRVGDIGIVFMRHWPLWNEMDYSWFRGMQHRGTVIGLYWPRGRTKPLGQVAVGLNFSVVGVRPQAVWVGNKKVDTFTGTLPPLQPVWISDHGTYITALPLRGGALRDKDRATLLEEKELKNKTRRVGIWWRNFVDPAKPVLNDDQLATLRGGFVLQCGSREEDGSFEAFRRRVSAFTIEETCEAGIWTVRLHRGKDVLVLRYDMKNEKALESSVNGRPNRPTYLFEAPHLAKGNSGTVRVGRTVVEGKPDESLWLFADETRHHYAVLKTTDARTPVTLRTPDGTVSVDPMPLGRCEVRLGDRPAVTVEALDRVGTVQVQGPTSVPGLTLNGRLVPMTAEGEHWRWRR